MGKATEKPGRGSGITRELGAFSGLLMICIGLSIAKPDAFPQSDNLLNVLMQISPVAIVAAGMTFVIISGGIDLSVGSVLAFSACAGGYLADSMGLNAWLAMFGGLIAGLAFGALNGVMVTKIGLPPFIATLGTMGIARGFAFLITDGGTIYDLDDAHLYLGQYSVGGLVPVAILVFAVVYLVGHLFLTRTPTGRYLYAIGGSEDAAHLSGVPVARTKILAYAVTGLLAALAGIIWTGRVRAAAPQAGDGFELDVIAAVVIGGTSLTGGQGRLVGSIIGAMIMGVVRNGLNLLAVGQNWQRVVIGSIIVLAATIDILQKRRTSGALYTG